LKGALFPLNFPSERQDPAAKGEPDQQNIEFVTERGAVDHQHKRLTGIQPPQEVADGWPIQGAHRQALIHQDTPQALDNALAIPIPRQLGAIWVN